MPELLEPRDGLRADARDQARGGLREALRAPSAVSTRKPSGFSASEATFATSLFGPMPIEQVSPVSALHGLLDGAGRGAVPLDAR